MGRTLWVLGDQLHPTGGVLAGARPGVDRILFVLSLAKLRERPWHRQRAHLFVAGMRRLAVDLERRGFEVDWREADSWRAGLEAHVRDHRPDAVEAMEPLNRRGRATLERLGVELRRNDQFLCHYDEFADWADRHQRGDGSVLLEDFYRWQRRRLGVLMDGDAPAGGRWNLDADNRQPPPRDGRDWPPVTTSALDELDREVMDHLESLPGVRLFGAPPDGTWATSRRRALHRLQRFVEEVLPGFGAHQDAMLQRSWAMRHSLLSHALNAGMLHPGEVVEAAEIAYREGRVPLNSAEGFVRQVVGWREFVWGLYWWRDADWRAANVLGNDQPLPPAFTGAASTDARCVATSVGWIERHAYAHHIPRLMVLANLATLAGVRPQELTAWMHASFVDGADWVMVPNVVGMGMYADGGSMSTKPYVSGGKYIDRMSDFCGDCRYDPKQRVGERACPFTTLYWDFLDRHRDVLADNRRLARPYATLERLADVEEVRRRAKEVRARLAAGTL
ncbi:cryptochrome/photolyase family protein [Egicoccus sp. AB-alg2]|uniref:cryptochrome/photolyase family protein n=1 Tax=Egicoccus sp. AB-alg2 TaxID=3242693 RepID=UPI00359D6D52